MRRGPRSLALVATCSLLVGACGTDAGSPAPAAAPATGSATAAPDALRFTAPLVGGGEIDLAGYTGRPVLFWFWAPY